MTANQLVAYNLRRIREAHGLTQEQASEKLEPLMGKRWSQASFSAAESSAKGGRVRVFDANEILAFSIAFDVPVSYFFLPVDRQDRISAGGANLKAEKILGVVAPEAVGGFVADRLAQLGVKDERFRRLEAEVGGLQDSFREVLETLAARLVPEDTPTTKGGRHGKTS